MSLIKYNRPNDELLSRSFNDIIDEFFNNAPAFRKDRFMPSVDISEDEKQFEVSVALPGMKKEDIKVDLENGRLSISGERKMENQENGKNYYRVESAFGSFSRSFFLPDSVDEDSIEAKYEDGLLNITIQKDETKTRKQIEIA